MIFLKMGMTDSIIKYGINFQQGKYLVNKFYSEHKYNLIYVTSFPELMEAYRRVENPISYKEVKKNAETIFLMIDDDSAWIYRLSKNK